MSIPFLLALNISGQGSTDALRQKAKDLAQEVIILDGHIDLPYRLHNHGLTTPAQYLPEVLNTTRGEFDFAKAKKGGLDVAFMSVYIPASYQQSGGGGEYADSLISLVNSIIREYPDKFAPCLNTAMVRSNFGKGLISLPMGMENGAPILTFEDLHSFYEKGIRYITLTHSKDNHISDSSYDNSRTWGGLSEYGKSLIGEMNRVGMLIDISHVSDQAFFQVIELTEVPVIATHSSCRKYTPGWERNMSDDMIRKLAENGGVIQINFGSDFIDAGYTRLKKKQNAEIDSMLNAHFAERSSEMAKELIAGYRKANPRKYASVQQVVDHIDHVVKLVGIDHVGLGSDFDGVGDSLPTGLKDASEFPNLVYELLKRGYSDKDIQAICSGNVLRVWEKVEEFAQSQ